MSGRQSPEGSSVDQSTRQPSFVVRHKRMQPGLFKRASNYANNAYKPTSPTNRVKGILVTKKEPVIKEGASARRTLSSQNEINNNDLSSHKMERKSDFARNVRLPVTAEKDPAVIAKERATTRTYTRTPRMQPTVKTINFADPLEIDESEVTSSQKENPFPSEVKVEVSVSESSPTLSNSSRYNSDLSFNTTQQLRTGFFRSIKRQYSPILTPKQTEVISSQCSTDSGFASQSTSQTDEDENETSQECVMSKLARHKLEQLRRRGAGNVNVPTGLQWIRLELHEMREQDKSLFLQLIKLHSAIKDLRADMSGDDDFDSYDDLHSAASLWWPRRGNSFDTLPDFSSSDGAQLFRGCKSKTPLRRGFSLNYPPNSSPAKCSPDLSHRENSISSLMNNSEFPPDITTSVTAIV